MHRLHSKYILKFNSFLLLLILLSFSGVSGQQILGLSYNIAVPVGGMKDVIDQTSWVGFGVEGRQFTDDHTAFGLSFFWNKFIASAPIAGPLFETRVDQYPLTLNISYFTGSESSEFRPYAALNAGAFFITAWTETGKDKNVHLGIAPEIGFLANLFHDLNAMVFIRYNYPFSRPNSDRYVNLSVHLTVVSISIL